MKLFITGAGGFLGTAVTRVALERGHDVVMMVRRANDAPVPHDQSDHVTVVEGDLRHRSDWTEALVGCDAVIHLAVGVGDYFAQFSSTVVGTERLIDEMRAAGVSRLVHISTFSIYDYRAIEAGTALDETAPLEHAPLDCDDYTQTKLLQEQLVRAFGAEGGRVTVLRPGAIYGPGRLWDAGLAGSMIDGVWLQIGSRVAQKLTYVDNCADAIVLAAERDEAIGETLNIIDDHPPTQRQFAHAMRRHGLDVPRSIPAPAPVVRAIGTMLAVLNRRCLGGRLRLPFYLEPPRFEGRFKAFTYPNGRAKIILGWTPRIDLDAAMTAIAAAERVR